MQHEWAHCSHEIGELLVYGGAKNETKEIKTTNDIVERLKWWALKFCGKGEQETLASVALSVAADEILRLRNRIAVMEVEKSLADACLPSGYVRQTFKTGTGNFSKFQGKKDD